MNHWTRQQLATLRRLREGFLTGSAGSRDYWQSPEDLALYDATYGERIGWKWDAVLSELTMRGWRPQSSNLFDFACGSGIAGRRAAAHWPSQFMSLTLHDRSAAAMRHAEARAREFAGLEVRSATFIGALPENTLLVLSHVINELTPDALDRVLALCRQAREIIWVEPGTHAESRRLISEVREPLLKSGEYAAVAPCTHQAACGMLDGQNRRHWCHHFANPPSSAFQDAGWAEFSREAGIDLRSLPYSFLVMERRRERESAAAGVSRVIGQAREYKGFCKVLSCQAQGVSEFTLQKRDAPEVFRELRDSSGRLACYRWALREGKIIGGERPFQGIRD